MQVTDEHSLPLVVGIDLGGTQLRVAVVRGSSLLSRIAMLTGEDRTPASILPRLYNAVQAALTQAGVSIEHVAGIGIAAPGPLDPRTGVVYSPPNMPGWDSFPLRAMFAERFHIPIFVENDAHTAALGEYMFGAGRGSRHMVYLTISTGIGGGVILDGKILEGASGTAAELGHMTIDWHGERCACGNIGCLEHIASGTAIARQANAAIQSSEGIELLAFARSLQQQEDRASEQEQEQDYAIPAPPTPGNAEAPPQQLDGPIAVDARVVALAAAVGIPLARTIVGQAAEALGVGLVSIIHCFNPDLIILGGSVTRMGDLLLAPALRIVQERAMQAPRDAARITLAQLGENVGLIGAGALVYYYAP